MDGFVRRQQIYAKGKGCVHWSVRNQGPFHQPMANRSEPSSDRPGIPEPERAGTDVSMDLYGAALEWEAMLKALAAGQTVNQAVAAGNAATTLPPDPQNQHRWKVIGNGNVTIR